MIADFQSLCFVLYAIEIVFVEKSKKCSNFNICHVQIKIVISKVNSNFKNLKVIHMIIIMRLFCCLLLPWSPPPSSFHILT